MFVTKKRVIFVTVKGKGDGKGKAPGLHLSTLSGATKKLCSMAKVVKFSDLYKSIEAAKCGKSKWENGVHFLALTIVGNYEANEPGTACELGELESTLLNGAANWSAYCYGGNLLIYDKEIAEQLCSPSELRRRTSKNGALKDPNRREIWMDVQARAAAQAWQLIRDCASATTSRFKVVPA